MGIQGLRSYITKNAGLYSRVVKTTWEIRWNGMNCRNGMNVVLDGMSLLFAVHSELVRRSQGAPFCYQAIRDELFKFFDYMCAKNLVLKCIVTDTLPDELKFREYASRNISRTQDLETFWINDCRCYRSFFLGILNRSWKCIIELYLVCYVCYSCWILLWRDWLSSCWRWSRQVVRLLFVLSIYLQCRDVAKAANEYNACVISNDSDFFLYDINGVIMLEDLTNAYNREST